MEIAFSPQVVIHPTYSVFYSKMEVLEGCYNSKRVNNLTKNYKKPINKLSDNSKRKLQKSINYLTYISTPKKVFNPKYSSTYQFKLNFITLTLSSKQIHTDGIINHNLLNQFLIEAKKKWGVSRYVWKSEYQRNGNIHYHIITNVYIPHKELTNTWNRIQNKLGYIDRYNNNDKKCPPNSTDIHSVRKVKKLNSYLCKYMLKSTKIEYIKVKRSDSNYSTQRDKNIPSVSINAKKYLRSLIDFRRIWGCSKDLSNISGFKSDEVDMFYKELDILAKKGISKKLIKDHCEIFVYNSELFTQKNFPIAWEAFSRYLGNTFNYQVQRSIFESTI